MGGYGCLCGYTWHETDVDDEGHANEGWVVRDQDMTPVRARVSERIASFIQAISTGRRTEWLIRYFRISDGNADAYAEDAHVVEGILSKERKVLFIYQCENCGRLWLQETPSGPTFRSFAPDGEWKDSLAARYGSYAEEKLSHILDKLRENRKSGNSEKDD